MQQYIVYCNNISYIATIYRILQYMFIYYPSNASSSSSSTSALAQSYILQWKWMDLRNWKLIQIQKNYKKKKKILLATNSREFHIAIYCSLRIKNMTMSQYSPQTRRIYCNIRFREQYAIYIAYIAIYCQYIVAAIYCSLKLLSYVNYDFFNGTISNGYANF